MKVLLQITLVLCIFSMYHNNELNDQSTGLNHFNISDDRLQMTRTKLSIFPKIKAKFLVQHKKSSNKDKNTKYAVTKKPIMTKFVPRVKTEVETSSKMSVTRLPLMKLRAYTIKTFSNHKLYNKDNNNVGDKQNDVDKKAVSNENVILNDKSTISQTKPMKIQSALLEPRKNNHMVITTPVNYFAEESRDRNEYIFLNVNSDGKIETTHKKDFLRPGDEDYETTTEIDSLRMKRNINIIEEESKPTKYPGWKYNEHDTKVNSDRFYSNINT